MSSQFEGQLQFTPPLPTGELLISKEFHFEAAHVLPKHQGKCSHLHGHSWVLRITIAGLVDPTTGFVLDYSLLKTVVNNHIVDKLDHSFLGYGTAAHSGRDSGVCSMFGVSFYPSSENLVIAIARILTPIIKELKKDVRLYQVILDETCTSRAIWTAPLDSGSAA